MSKLLPWIVFVGAVLLVVAGVVNMAKQNGGGETGQTYPITIAADDWVEGPADAPLTLVEYSDFQCPACAAYAPVVKQMRAEFASSTRFVYRNFPLQQHKNAKIAAYVAGAAGMQGKFFAMHDALFEHQLEWSDSSTPETLFLQYAQTIGLDLNRLKTDLASKAVQDKVDRDVASGQTYNVNATPTFFLNGKKLQNPASPDAFRALLNAALRP